MINQSALAGLKDLGNFIMDNKTLLANTLDELRSEAYSVLSIHNEHMQQLAVFLTLPLKFKYAPLEPFSDSPLKTLTSLQQHAAHSYVLGIYNTLQQLSNYDSLREGVENMHIEWYYISHLESVFVQVGGLTSFLSWVARNQNTQPLNRAFLMYLDAVYAEGVDKANWAV